MRLLKLQYRLTEEELEEVFLCLDWKKEGKMRDINIWIISILGVLVLACYVRRPDHIFFAAVLICMIFLLFFLVYGPAASRKKKVKKLLKENGEYKVELTESGMIYGDDSRRLDFNGRKLKLLESEHMLLLKADREIFALPRRILTDGRQEQLRQTLNLKNCERICIEIKIGEGRWIWKKEKRKM